MAIAPLCPGYHNFNTLAFLMRRTGPEGSHPESLSSLMRLAPRILYMCPLGGNTSKRTKYDTSLTVCRFSIRSHDLLFTGR